MGRALLVSLAVVAGGCDKKLNPEYCTAHPTDTRCPQPDGPPGDGPADTGDGPLTDSQICIGTGAYVVCPHDPPTGPVALTAQTLDTDSTSTCQHFQPLGWTANGQPDVCLIVGTTLTTSGAIVARGSRPLVLAATDTITLAGTLDASARRNNPQTIPAGFAAGNCTAFASTPEASATGGGGGAGGTFRALGGDGGKGDNTTNLGGGAPGVGNAPTVLHAGCEGQLGADGDTAGNGGVPGNGGGVVYVVAGTSIMLANSLTINASGAGGTGGGHFAGGGGGGAGGTIVVWSPSIVVGTSVKIYANGGGGGAGGGTQNGNTGADPSAPTAPASGANTTNGGIGGNGFAGTTNATSGGNANAGAGGGGGGGGAGFILASSALNGATVSPLETLGP